MKSPRIFGREPSAILGLVAVGVQFFAAFVMGVDQDTQTAVNVTAVTGVGLVVAVMVHDGVIAGVTGLAQAVLALGMNLGLDWSADKQAAWMAVITVPAQFWFVRDRVTAPVPASAVKPSIASVA